MMVNEGARRRILFIVNPISGVGKQRNIENLIGYCLDKSLFDAEVVYTSGPGDATAISRDAAQKGFDIVAAVGGDGTVNETAAGLVGTGTALAIVPAGSGNGLARHLKIPMKIQKALDIIGKGKIMKIDTATLNDQVFVNLAGVGFDASVAKKFAAAGKRGFSTYFRITASTFLNYKPKKYRLIIDGEKIKRRALFVSFANSSQFGNNTSIDPSASITDGYIDVCIVSKMSLWRLLIIAPLLFLRKFDRTRYVEIIRAKEILLKRKKGKSVHLDGDPAVMGRELTIRINPLSLSVVAP